MYARKPGPGTKGEWLSLRESTQLAPGMTWIALPPEPDRRPGSAASPWRQPTKS